MRKEFLEYKLYSYFFLIVLFIDSGTQEETGKPGSATKAKTKK